MSATSDERLTHFVRGGQEAIAEAMELGTPLQAACGKVWVPSRDPDQYFLCPICLADICEGWAA